jgi:hypothetical protein
MLLAASLILSLAQADSGVGYEYYSKGKDWETNDKWVCGSGRKQSPIDFNAENTKSNGDIFLSGRGY